MGNKIELVCESCGTTFKREKREYKRNQKKGRKSYCSRSCSGRGNVGNIPKDKLGNVENLKKGSQKDELSPFRYHLRKSKSRNQEFNINLKYLKEVWENQKGKCIYTGVELEDWKDKGNNSMYTASLDRIDSNKGYVIGNVQFVSKNINYMKNSLSHEETVELCKIISEYWK